MWKIRLLLLSIAICISFTAWSNDVKTMLEQQCTQCHNFTGPAPATLEALQNRKGPDLFYAGNKYKRDWLASWLQSPSIIRPAGMYYGKHLTLTPKGDQIDTASLTSHPKLDAASAKQIADTLMTFKAKSKLIKPGEYKTGSIPKSLGEMMFDKFRGCLACHQIEPGYGGLSGPEVYSVAKRLQEDYLVSYMRNPQAWDKRIFMPNSSLSDADLQKFVHYFRTLAAEDFK